ncbi:MAG TPA: ABC transporter permease [Streptosporangiaceae bacterium]|nr:ABC transporter permease [Streptosporangiaceae bacterium]
MRRSNSLAARTPEPVLRKLRGPAAQAAALVAFLLIIGLVWDLLAAWGGFPRLLFPTASQILERLWSMARTGALLSATMPTLGRMALGFCIAALAGVPIGLWMGRSQIVEDFLSPTIRILLPIPSLAYVPLFILWLGLTLQAVVLLIVVSAVLPIIVNTWTGTKAIDRKLTWVAQSMDVRGVVLFSRVFLPAAVPSIMMGLRQGLSMSWRAAVGAEFFSMAQSGLGVTMLEAQGYQQTDVILSLLIIIMVISFALDKWVFMQIESMTINRWGMQAEKSYPGRKGRR